MAHWTPKTDFEHALVAAQPEYNFIFGSLNRQKRNTTESINENDLHLDLNKPKKSTNFVNSQLQKLSAISQVQKITKTKRLGNLPSLNDWDNDVNAQSEIVAMIRHFDIKSKNEDTNKFKISNKKIDKCILANGSTIPIIFDENCFKFSNHTPQHKNFTYSNRTTLDVLKTAAVEESETEIVNNKN